MFVLGGLGATAASCAASIAATCACHAAGAAGRALASRSARLAYCVFFLVSTLLAYVLREGAAPVASHLPWIARAAAAHAAPQAFYGNQAVLRVSLASATFFGGLAVALTGVHSRADARDAGLQHGAWGLKLAAFTTLTCGSFFLPVGLVNAYGVLARAGSAAFLAIQVLLLIDGTAAWNDAAVDCGDDRALWLLLGGTAACYAGAAAFLGVGFHFFNPSGTPGGCGFNVGVLILSALAGVLLSALSISGVSRRGSLFPASAVTLYVVYCAYAALVSEPHDFKCNALGRRVDAASAGAMAGGVFLTLASVVYSALRAGSASAMLGLGPGADDDGAWVTPGAGTRASLLGNSGDEELTSAGLDGFAAAGAPPPGAGDHGIAGARALGGGDSAAAAGTAAAVTGGGATASLGAVPSYSYAFFHAVFALASCYLAMLLTGWGGGAAERRLVDVGWASVAVKLGTAAVTAATYGWTLVAPALLPDRFPDV